MRPEAEVPAPPEGAGEPQAIRWPTEADAARAWRRDDGRCSQRAAPTWRRSASPSGAPAPQRGGGGGDGGGGCDGCDGSGGRRRGQAQAEGGGAARRGGWRRRGRRRGRGEAHERAPAAADVEVAHARLEEVHLLAEQVELVVLRLLERLVRPVVVRRRVNLPGPAGGGLSVGSGPKRGTTAGCGPAGWTTAAGGQRATHHPGAEEGVEKVVATVVVLVNLLGRRVHALVAAQPGGGGGWEEAVVVGAGGGGGNRGGRGGAGRRDGRSWWCRRKWRRRRGRCPRGRVGWQSAYDDDLDGKSWSIKNCIRFQFGLNKVSPVGSGLGAHAGGAAMLGGWPGTPRTPRRRSAAAAARKGHLSQPAAAASSR